MNRPHRPSPLSVLLLSLALLMAAASQAQPPPPGLPPAASEPAPSLPDWNGLTQEQRDQLTATIRDRWDNAAPAARARMLIRAEHWQKMPPRQRERISSVIDRWQGLSLGDHREFRALFHALTRMPDAERGDFVRHWAQMSAEERQAWLEANPPPPRAGRPAPARIRGPKTAPASEDGITAPAVR